MIAAGQPAPSAVGRRRAAVVAVFVVAATLVVLRLMLSAPLPVPLQVDELGYLGNARFLATGDGLVTPDGRAPYKIGYPLLLAPLVRFTGGEATPMLRAAQAVNALLAACMVPLGVWLAGRLRPPMPFADRLLAATCVSIYPAVSLYATTAMSFSLLATGYFAYLAAAWVATDRGTAAAWVGWGVLAGALYVVHERTIGWLAVALATAVIAALLRRRPAPLALLPAAFAVAAVERLVPLPGAAYDTASEASSIIRLAFARPSVLVATACGQPWYLWLASGGVLAVGLAAALWLRRRPSGLAGPPLFWLAATGSAASMVAASVLQMAHRADPRFTHWIYGRYNESVTVAALLVALVALAAPGRDRRRALAVGTAAALTGFAVLTVVLRVLWTPRIAGPYGFNAIGVCLWQQTTGFGLVRTPLAAAATAIALAAAFRFRWRLGAAALATFFLLSTWAATVGYFIPKSRNRARETQLVEELRRIDPQPRAVLYEARDWPSFHFYALSLRLPDWRLGRFGDGAAPPDDVELVISSRRQPESGLAGCRLTGLEWMPRGHPPNIRALWVRPGPLADRLAATGRLLPAEFPARLPPEALAADVRWTGVSDGEHITTGGERHAALSVRHRGTTPWPHRRGWKDACHTVAMLVRWVRADEGTIAAERLHELPRMVYPGDELEIRVTVVAADDRRRGLPAGRYRLEAAIAQRDRHRRPHLHEPPAGWTVTVG